MINIISTSIAYTDKGFVRIYSEVNEVNRMFSVIVEDSSLGLSEQELKRLIQGDLKIEKTPMFDANRPHPFAISISKQLAHSLNGEFEIVSSQGVGCKYIVKLPISQLEIDEYKKKPID